VLMSAQCTAPSHRRVPRKVTDGHGCRDTVPLFICRPKNEGGIVCCAETERQRMKVVIAIAKKLVSFVGCVLLDLFGLSQGLKYRLRSPLFAMTRGFWKRTNTSSERGDRSPEQCPKRGHFASGVGVPALGKYSQMGCGGTSCQRSQSGTSSGHVPMNAP
jgi:hypothetical protein